MKLSALPVLKPEPLLFDYDESRVDEFVHLYSELLGPLTALGVRPDEVPDDFFEAHVFLAFLYGAMGEVTASGSLFGANWRWMPAAEIMARKIGATGLADQLSEAWQEVQRFPPEILDCFDRGSLEWNRPEPAMGENVPPHQRLYTYVSSSVGERISYLLNEKWMADDINSLAIDPTVYLPAGVDYSLAAAVATYLSSTQLSYDIFHDRKKFSVRVANILDRCDDYEIRQADRSGTNPFEDVWQNLRGTVDTVELNNGLSVAEISPYRSIRNNSNSFASDGFLVSEVWTNCGLLLVAYYKDVVQIVDPHTFAELAAEPLPERFAMRSRAKERLTHAEAWPWRLSEGFYPVQPKFQDV